MDRAHVVRCASSQDAQAIMAQCLAEGFAVGRNGNTVYFWRIALA